VGTAFDEFIQQPVVVGFRVIFGTMSQAGSIVFHDAIPGKIENILVAEIMTPHFVDYYQDNDPPRDNQGPQPITYLAVDANVPFLFCISPRTNNVHENFVKLTTRWLIFALKDYGIGGKTASGMGRFDRQPAPVNEYIRDEARGDADAPSRSG
jgi:CRISPR-associated protein Cmr6